METSTAGLYTIQRERSRVRAARLLDAWIAGDRRRLDHELSYHVDGDPAQNHEDEREELLLSLMRQMRSEPDLYASRAEKLHLGVWFDILARLAEPE